MEGQAMTQGKGRIIVVGGDRGGSGKSTVAHLLALRLEMAGTNARLIEVDAEERLGKVFGPERVTSKVIAQAELVQIMEDPSLAFRLWEEIGEMLESGEDVVLDLGGNLSVAFADWARQAGVAYIGQGEGMDIVILCSGDPVGIESCQQTLGRFRRALPQARRWLVVNPLHAPLSAESETVQGIARAYGLAGVVEMKRCASPIFGAVLDYGEPFSRSMERPFRDFVSGGVTKGTAALGHSMFVSWVGDSLRALDPLAPNPPGKAAKAA